MDTSTSDRLRIALTCGSSYSLFCTSFHFCVLLTLCSRLDIDICQFAEVARSQETVMLGDACSLKYTAHTNLARTPPVLFAMGQLRNVVDVALTLCK